MNFRTAILISIGALLGAFLFTAAHAEEDGMLHQEVRYFPSDERDSFERIKDAFVSHYRNGRTGKNGDPKLNEKEMKKEVEEIPPELQKQLDRLLGK